MNDDVNPYASPESDPAPRKRTTSRRMKLAGRGTRLIAAILEGLVFMLAAIPVFIILATSGFSSEGLFSNSIDAVFIISALIILAIFGYNIFLIFTSQQTIGKKIMKIKVVRADGSPCSGARYLFLRIIVINIIGSIPFVSFVLPWLDPLLIFRKNKQCLHDTIADTNVVNC